MDLTRERLSIVFIFGGRKITVWLPCYSSVDCLFEYRPRQYFSQHCVSDLAQGIQRGDSQQHKPSRMGLAFAIGHWNCASVVHSLCPANDHGDNTLQAM